MIELIVVEAHQQMIIGWQWAGKAGKGSKAEAVHCPALVHHAGNRELGRRWGGRGRQEGGGGKGEGVEACLRIMSN